MIIDIVMPMKEGRYIPHEVLTGLLRQGIPFRLFVSTKVSNGDFPAVRNNIKQYGRAEFVLMLDNDIVLPDGALSKMRAFLQSHAEYAAIGLPKQDFSAMSPEWLLHALHKDNCGNNLPVATYTCQMLLNGAPVGSILILTLQAP